VFPLPASFDVANTGTTYLELAFLESAHTTFAPPRMNIDPGERVTVTMTSDLEEAVTYYPSYYADANLNTSYRYPAYRRGTTVGVSPVGPTQYAAMGSRAASVISTNRRQMTGGACSGQYTVLANPAYNGHMYGFDLMLMSEFGGESVTNADLKTYVDQYIALQLTEETNYCPVGQVPDRVALNGTTAYGTEVEEWTWYSRDTHLRGDLTKNLCLAPAAFVYGLRRGFDATWQTWFGTVKAGLAAAYNAVPKDGTTGLCKQWDTYPSCTWSCLDIIKQTGNLIGLSLLSVNTANALADMCQLTGDTSGEETWAATAAAMKSSVQAQFITDPGGHGGYLPWNTGNMPWFSPEYSALAVWAEALTDAQSDDVSDWFAYLWEQDQANHPTSQGHLFSNTVGVRGATRRSHLSDDYDPTGAILGYPSAWPDWFPTEDQWAVQGVGASTYGHGLNGGYGYWTAAWLSTTLARKHLDYAIAHATGMVTDAAANADAAWEVVYHDGTTVNGSYSGVTAAVYAAAASGSSATVGVSSISIVPRSRSADTWHDCTVWYRTDGAWVACGVHEFRDGEWT
jgi:hypothetical protein